VKACVIFNPAARGDKARRFRRRLDELASDCVLKPTTGPDAARALAREAVDEGFPTLVAAGGDGTVNEVINGIGDAADGFQRAALGLIPLGTANVFAREFGIPFATADTWNILRQNHTRVVDLIRVDFTRRQRTESRWMVQVGGAGLDARAVELVSWNLKKRVGVLAYIVAGLRALSEPQPRITATANELRTAGELILIGNGRLYGGPFALFPAADPADGLLDVRVFPRAGWKTALLCGLGTLTGRFGRSLGTADFRAPLLQLSSNSRVPLQIDGELIGELPASFRVEPRQLRVIVREPPTPNSDYRPADGGSAGASPHRSGKLCV
jgi:YegS/Rv2252/BmrU family lipid kinase